MNLPKRIASSLAVLALIASTAFATTISECQTDIANLRAETHSATFTGANAAKDEAGLLGKLDAAATSLDKGKFCDAIQKLNDFKTRVNQLIAAGKIDAATGQQLLADADDAIACIRSVAMQAGKTCP